jgi:hypothetical protein
MEEHASPFAVYPGGQPGRGDGPPPRQYQELWLLLSRLPWVSVVLVPVHPSGSAADIANALAEVGSRLRDTPVTAIVANGIDYKSARALADLQPTLSTAAGPVAFDVEANPVERDEDGGPVPPAPGTKVLPPLGRAIIAIKPIVAEPLGVVIAQAADAVVLCIDLGRSRMRDARRTIELIGPERILGAFVIR